MSISTRKKSAHLLTVIGLLIGILTLLVYHLNLVFSESLYFKRNSYAYYLVLDNHIKGLPTYKPVQDSIRYRYGIGDGVTYTTHSVFYVSSESADRLNALYSEYFMKNHYLRTKNASWPSLQYFADDKTFYILDITPENDANRVSIDYVEM